MLYKCLQTSCKYTLHVIYEKLARVEYDFDEWTLNFFSYTVIGLPTSSDIFEDDRLLEHHKNYKASKYIDPNFRVPKQEFQLRSDDFSSLRKLRDHLMYSPHECRAYSFIVENTEVVADIPQTDKVVFNFAKWEAELKFLFFSSRDSAKWRMRDHKAFSTHGKHPWNIKLVIYSIHSSSVHPSSRA